MKQMLKKIILLAAVFTIIPGAAFGRSTENLVEQGNLAYGHGRFDEALKLYRQAAKKAPGSPYVQFDLGNALYKKGAFKEALSAYKQAAAKSRNPLFIGKNKFNQGNAVFRQAEVKQKKDPTAALRGMNDSLHYYREAIALNPGLTSAATNIEVAKDRINKVKKELARREARRQAAEKARKKMATKLKQMAQKQQNMASRSRQQAVVRKKQNKGDMGKEMAAQQNLRARTRKMADKMAGQQKKQGASKDLSKAEDALHKALAHQDKALDNLKNKAPEKAAAQEKATKNLREALASLQDHDKTKEPPENKKGGAAAKQKKSSARQDQNQKAMSGEKGKPEKLGGQQAQAFKLKNPPNQTAEDLLNKERQHDLLRRQEQSRSRYEAVDKNW